MGYSEANPKAGTLKRGEGELYEEVSAASLLASTTVEGEERGIEIYVEYIFHSFLWFAKVDMYLLLMCSSGG